MAIMPTSIKVNLPIFTKAGDALTEEQFEMLDSLGLVHIGDALIDVPVDFQQSLPFDEIETTLTGATQAVEADPSMLEGPHSRACGVLPHQHGPRCHPNCPTCGKQAGVGDGSGVTVPEGSSPAPGPVAPEVTS